MNRLHRLMLALAAVTIIGSSPLAAPQAQPAAAAQAFAPGSIEAAIRQHPASVAQLLASLDLARPELAAVAAAQASGDTAGALRALLAVYRTGAAPAWIAADYRVHAPNRQASADDIRSSAAAALQNRYTFQGVTGTLPRTLSGNWDWDHRGPRDDREWALFLNRHFNLMPLLLAAREQGNAPAAAKAAELITDWVTTRPVDEKPVERDISPAWQPMSSASRLLQVWPQLFFGLIDHPAFTDEARILMLASIPQQAEHLKKHHRKAHNHTIKEMSGLAHAGAVWPQFKGAGEWRRYGIEMLAGELARQFYPDGVHQELSAHYHRSALEYYVWVKDFMASAGTPLPGQFASAIEKSADYLAMTLSPSGHGLLNNNGDLDDNRERVLTLARRFGREDWRFAATGGEGGAAPARQSVFYPWAGQAVMRDGWGPDATFAVIDVGPWGAAHQHNDKLNLVLAGYGRDLLVDGGRYRYEATDPVVMYLRGSSGHNVILLDGKGQKPDDRVATAPLADAFFTSPAVDFAQGSFTAGFEGLAGDARHQRALIHVRSGPIIVIDRIVTDRPRTASALFRHAPDVSVTHQGMASVSADVGMGNLRITPVSPRRARLTLTRGQDSPEPMGWFSPDYNDRRPATVARFDHAIGGTSILAHVLTTAKGTPATPAVRVRQRSADRIALDIRLPGEDVLKVQVDMAHWEGGNPSGTGLEVRRGKTLLARFARTADSATR